MSKPLSDYEARDARAPPGLVGQNLIVRLKDRGARHIVALDKHAANVAALAKFHPDITVIEADLAGGDGWQQALAGADALLMLHAQIGGLYYAEFEANNISASVRSAGLPPVRPAFPIWSISVHRW